MELIDKDAVVAEIERRVKEGEIIVRYTPSSAIFGLMQAYKNVLSFLDTLEVKEVDLEKEIQAFAKMDLYPIELSDTNLSIIVTKHQIYNCARHFFNFGLKAREGKL